MSDTLKLGKKELAEAAPDSKDLVLARFEGSADPTEPAGVLEHEGHRLVLGRVVGIPRDVFAHLTSGENARLYRVVEVSKDDADELDEPLAPDTDVAPTPTPGNSA